MHIFKGSLPSVKPQRTNLAQNPVLLTAPSTLSLTIPQVGEIIRYNKLLNLQEQNGCLISDYKLTGDLLVVYSSD